MTDSARLSVQLYSLRSITDPAVKLRVVRASGLKCVETSSSDHAEARRMRRLLDENDLAAPSGHYGIEAFRERLAWVVDTAGILGQQLVVLWGFPENEHWPERLGWARAGEELGRIAERLQDAGLTFAFHNHDWELRRFQDGRLALDVLFDTAAGSPLRFQPDLAWIVRGGKEPRAILDRHADKVVACHVKDLAPAGDNADEDGWADLGQGRITWHELWPAVRAAGASLMVLEHDAPRDPTRFLAVSVAAARALALRSREQLE